MDKDASKFLVAKPGLSLGMAVIDRLVGFDLPVTPAHYEVIFAYQTGAPVALVQEIEAMLARGERVTHGLSEAVREILHQRAPFGAHAGNGRIDRART